MSLSVQPLYNEMQRQFTASGSSERFKSDFIDSFNNVLDEMIVAGDTAASDLPHISSESGAVSYLSPQHARIVKAGLRYNMMQYGQIPASGGTDALTLAARDWSEAKGQFMILLSRASQATVDDSGNPSGDIIGLGYLGDVSASSADNA